MARTLLDCAVWNQLNDGNDVFQTQDCGFECVAMFDNLIKRSQPDIREGTYREELGQLQHLGINRPGLTTADDLHELLTYLGIPSQIRRDNTYDARLNINQYLHNQQGCIVLGTWDSPELHWMAFLDSPQGPDWIVNDPWGGVRRTITNLYVTEHYANSYVRLLVTPDSLP